MTRRERVIAALEFKKPDYVPYSIGFTRAMHEKMVDYLGDPDFQKKIHNHIISTGLAKEEIDLGHELFQDEWGVVWNKSGVDKDIGVVENYLLEDEDELDHLQIPFDEDYIRHLLDNLVKNKEDRFATADLGFLLFERAWTLRGMENLLCDMIVNPEFVHALFQRITDRALKIIDIILEYKEIDAVYLGDDYGQQKGLIMGPIHWREFIKPYLTQIYAKIHAGGKYVFQHSCGDLREILDDMIEIGLNAYITFQPEIYTFEYVKHLYGRLTIFGGISTQVHLPVKTPEEIYDLTKYWISCCPDGGLIAAPTHAIPGDVPPENVMAMLRAMEEQEK